MPFYDLELPIILEGEWYVGSDKLDYYLRNDGSGLDDGNGRADLFSFNSAWDAHAAAQQYYLSAGATYPHKLEWKLLKQPALAASQTPTISGSTVMEFI